MSTTPAPIDPRQIDYLPLSTLAADPRNPKAHDEAVIDASIGRFGMLDLIVRDDRTGYIVSGHGRRKALRAMEERGESAPEGVKVDADSGAWLVPVVVGWSSRTDSEAAAALIALNRTTELGGWVDDSLLELLDDLSAEDDGLVGVGYGDEEIDALRALLDEVDEGAGEGYGEGAEGEEIRKPGPSLSEQFGIPPLSVLDTRRGEWRERKRAWLDLGIRSEVGRDAELVYDANGRKYFNWYYVKNAAHKAEGRVLSNEELMEKYSHLLRSTDGTSIFDPVLTEIIVRWFSAPGARVLDPWAGGSVRGIVSGAVGRSYDGIELRAEQVEANKEQLPLVQEAVRAGLSTEGPGVSVSWHVGDSRTVMEGWEEGGTFDLAIGCPPYYHLEKYSDDPQDLSTMSPEEFDAEMAATLKEVARHLRDNAFAVFVVGSVRETRGSRAGRVLDMRRCMSEAAEAADMWLYNDFVLVTMAGSVGIGAGRSFSKTRVMGRVHQEVLVFCKGDRRKATEAAGGESVESFVLDLPEEADEDAGETFE